MLILKKPIAFLWDSGNCDKNWQKHRVSNSEIEEVFFDLERRILKDKLHSGNEDRYLMIGRTKKKRALLIVFTLREKKVRAISARDLNKKEYHYLGKI